MKDEFKRIFAADYHNSIELEKMLGLSPKTAKRLLDNKDDLRKMLEENEESFGIFMYKMINERYINGTSEKKFNSLPNCH